MTFDVEIKLAGVACEIIRSPNNINTFIYHGTVGKLSGGSASPDDVHRAGYYLPTDCGATPGDLLLIDSEYYLLMSFEKIYDNGVHACYKGQLYKCNAVLSFYGYNKQDREHNTLLRSGVHAFLTQNDVGAGMDTDKAYAVSAYRGRSVPFNAFMQASAGLTKHDVVVDQDNRRYRVVNNFDPYIANGIIYTKLYLEGR
jgi:hypothetical protein